MPENRFAQVLVPKTRLPALDYKIPDNLLGRVQPWTRVLVPVGRRTVCGLVQGLSVQSNFDSKRIKPLIELLDEQPLWFAADFQWLQWVNQYYHHQLADTVFTAVPGKQAYSADAHQQEYVRCTKAGLAVEVSAVKAQRQRQAMALLQKQDTLSKTALQASGISSSVLSRLQEKAWLEIFQQENIREDYRFQAPVVLNEEQLHAVATMQQGLGSFACFLLQGVTGSGKTEVYFQLIESVLQNQQQVLLLVPEIGLTPQLLQRVQSAFSGHISIYHSAMTEKQRWQVWHDVREGRSAFVVGTRSAVFLPFPSLGLMIIDEEHDASFKQQDGLRYSARDIAVKRAADRQIPIVLGSATPSLESLHNVDKANYQLVKLQRRSAASHKLRLHLADMNQAPWGEVFSPFLIERMQSHLRGGSSVLLFINRRGYAPRLTCAACNHVMQCRRCDASLTYHRSQHKLICHHCGSQQTTPKQCPACSSLELRFQGSGTEKIEEQVSAAFPQYTVLRIDRDNTRRKDSFNEIIERVQKEKSLIMVGTQMLAKGHNFENITLSAILDADSGLFAADFRATERMAQLIVQVAGRAGRGQYAGEVVIQTRYPQHEILQMLLHHGYETVARHLLKEREQALLPPYAYLCIIRASATDTAPVETFLAELASQLRAQNSTVQVLGPVPAVMERRAGRYRMQLWLLCSERKALHQLSGFARHCANELKSAQKVRWSLDMDAGDID